MKKVTAKDLMEEQRKRFFQMKRKEQENNTPEEAKTSFHRKPTWECTESVTSVGMILEGGIDMTNFEHMKQKIVETIMGLDEMELLRLAEDTEMCMSGMEGVFNCTICQKEYGDCGDYACNDMHSARYREWCRKEHQGKKNHMAAVVRTAV